MNKNLPRSTHAATFLALLALGGVSGACGSKAGTPVDPNAVGPGDDDEADSSTADASVAPGDDASAPPTDASSAHDASVPPGTDASGPSTTSSVSIIVEPSEKGAALVTAIKAATTSIHVVMYLMTSTQVMTALTQAKARGVEVKVILNQNFPTAGNSNASAYTTLTNGGVSVVYAPTFFTYTHEKCVIIDGKTAWIMTMNTTQTSATANREFLAVDTDPADVAEAEAIFQGDYAGPTLNNPAGKLLVAPVNAREGLVALIGTATTKIDVEGEEFSDTKITTALTQKATAGIPVRVVVADGSTSPAQAQAITSLKQAGVKVVATTTPYIHAKAIVVDGARAYVGSENFTAGSLGYNRELGLIVDATAEVAKVSAAIATDYANGTPQ